MTKTEMFDSDIEALNNCLRLIEGTKLYLYIDKGKLLSSIIEQIWNLEDKRERHLEILETLKS